MSPQRSNSNVPRQHPVLFPAILLTCPLWGSGGWGVGPACEALLSRLSVWQQSVSPPRGPHELGKGDENNWSNQRDEEVRQSPDFPRVCYVFGILRRSSEESVATGEGVGWGSHRVHQ